MKTSLSRALLPSLIGVGFALASSASLPANAFSIAFGSTSKSSNTTATGASAKVDFSFSNINSTSVLLNLKLTNTTGQIPAFGSKATQSTLVGFGFDILDNLKFSYSSLSSPFTKLYGDASLTTQRVEGAADLQPFGVFDAGIRSAGSGNFTGGNAQSGLTAGQSTDVSFTLKGTNLTAASVESEFLKQLQSGQLKVATRFQQVNAGAGSDKLLGGTITVAVKPKPKRVPEPMTTTGLGLVAGVLLAARRLKVSKLA